MICPIKRGAAPPRVNAVTSVGAGTTTLDVAPRKREKGAIRGPAEAVVEAVADGVADAVVCTS